ALTSIARRRKGTTRRRADCATLIDFIAFVLPASCPARSFPKADRDFRDVRPSKRFTPRTRTGAVLGRSNGMPRGLAMARHRTFQNPLKSTPSTIGRHGFRVKSV